MGAALTIVTAQGTATTGSLENLEVKQILRFVMAECNSNKKPFIVCAHK